MADKKKTNLPAEILSGPEMDRRKFLGGVAGAVVSDILDSTAIRGLSDLLTKEGKLIKVPASALNQNVRKLLSQGASLEKVYENFFKDAISDTGIVNDIRHDVHNDYGPIGPNYDEDLYWKNEGILEDMDGYLDDVHGQILDTHTKMMDITSDIETNLKDQGYSADEAYAIAQEFQIQSNSGWDTVYHQRFNDFRKNIDSMSSLDSKREELKDWADRGYYGSSEEVQYLDTLYDKLEWQRKKGIRQESDPATMIEETQKLLNKEIKKIQLEAPRLLEAPKQIEEPSPATIEDRMKDVATTRTFKELRRALGKLGTPKPEAIEGPKSEASKQIEGPKETNKPSINKLLTALSIFKKGTPLGAAASVMRPTPTAEDDDLDFEIPVDR